MENTEVREVNLHKAVQLHNQTWDLNMHMQGLDSPAQTVLASLPIWLDFEPLQAVSTHTHAWLAQELAGPSQQPMW